MKSDIYHPDFPDVDEMAGHRGARLPYSKGIEARDHPETGLEEITRIEREIREHFRQEHVLEEFEKRLYPEEDILARHLGLPKDPEHTWFSDDEIECAYDHLEGYIRNFLFENDIRIGGEALVNDDVRKILDDDEIARRVLNAFNYWREKIKHAAKFAIPDTDFRGGGLC